MELILLGIYSYIVWLIFFKFKWLPWNFISQVIVVTIPIVGLTLLILLLNIVAPSSADVRVVNYVTAVNARLQGMVIDVPISPNQHIKKGQILFRLDPRPMEIEIQGFKAQIESLQAQLLSAGASTTGFGETVRNARGSREAIVAQLKLAREREAQTRELAATGAGSQYDYQQAQMNVANLQAQLDAATATERSAQAKVGAKNAKGDQDEIANVKAKILQAESQLADAQWRLEQTVYRAPADGTVVSLSLRPGAMAVPLPITPAMTFVEDEQWVMAIFRQNEVRKIKPGQEAEISLRMYPGRIIKCKVDSIMWATAAGQLPIGFMNNMAGVAPVPPNSLAVRLL
ncbi:MAG TPA: efflux RND transporter periplasmic adaptor subunit, partial [Steroidobacteraceae bacterium]